MSIIANAVSCVLLLGSTFAFHIPQTDSNLLKTLTCQGQIILINLDGPNTPFKEPHHTNTPCHAVCCKQENLKNEDSD